MYGAKMKKLRGIWFFIIILEVSQGLSATIVVCFKSPTHFLDNTCELFVITVRMRKGIEWAYDPDVSFFFI